jgi:hypothetical protein
MLLFIHLTIQTFGMEISRQETKVMASIGEEPVRSEIVIAS